MDMTLYSLVLSKLENQDSCLLWNGFRIEVVDELPESQAPNTIYFVKSNFALTSVDEAHLEEEEVEEEEGEE